MSGKNNELSSNALSIPAPPRRRGSSALHSSAPRAHPELRNCLRSPKQNGESRTEQRGQAPSSHKTGGLSQMEGTRGIYGYYGSELDHHSSRKPLHPLPLMAVHPPSNFGRAPRFSRLLSASFEQRRKERNSEIDFLQNAFFPASGRMPNIANPKGVSVLTNLTDLSIVSRIKKASLCRSHVLPELQKSPGLPSRLAPRFPAD